MPEKSLAERQAEMRDRMKNRPRNAQRPEPVVVREKRTYTSEEIPPGFAPTITERQGTFEITREDLHKLVWSEPLTKAAKRFNVSDVAVAKACRKAAIPLPGLGYWARHAAGQKIRRPELPDGPASISFTPLLAKEIPVAVKSDTEVPIPASTRTLHPSAAETYTELRRQFEKKPIRRLDNDYGRTWPRPGLLEIRVTEASLNRAVRIMSALLTAATKAGHVVKVGDAPSHRPGKEVQVIADGIRMNLEMFEPVTRQKHIPTPNEQREIDRGRSYMVPRYDFLPSGKLQLTLRNPLGPDAVWRDKYSQKVEDFLGAVVDTFSVFAKQGKERLRQKEIEDKKRAEAERRRYEEQQRVRRLTGQLKAWKEVRDIRDYIQAVESAVIARNGKVDPADSVSQWIAWMKNYANSIDPSQREDLGRENEWEWSYENSTYS